MQKMMKATALASLATFAAGQDKCCETCPSGQQKYYSVDSKHGHCGEACLNPSSFKAFKIFEPNLTIADGSTGYTSCAELGWPRYTETVTHGDPLKILTCTLDLYDHDGALSIAGQDGNQAMEVIAGLAKGLFNDDILSTCIVHVGETNPSMESSIEDLGAALKTMNPKKIEQTFKKLREVLRSIPQELQDCGANLQDVQQLLDAFKDIVPSILGELVSARSSFHIGNWEGVGEHVGRALRLLVQEAPHVDSANPKADPDPDPVMNTALQLIMGLSYGLFNDQTFAQCVTTALQNTPDLQCALNNLVTALKGKQLAEIKKALIEVVNVLKTTPGSLMPCAADVGDIQHLLVTLQRVGPQFVDDIEESLRSLRSGNFEEFGENVGKAVRVVISERPDVSEIVV